MTISEVLTRIEKKGVFLENVASCTNLEFMKYTILHREAIKRLEKELGIEYLQISKYHDLDKIAFYYVLSTKEASDLYKSIQKHHNSKCFDYKTVVEKILDWESAPLTKPDKPLSAYETLLKYKVNEIHTVGPVLRELNLWGEENCRCITWEEYYERVNSISVTEVTHQLLQGIDYVKTISTVV